MEKLVDELLEIHFVKNVLIKSFHLLNRQHILELISSVAHLIPLLLFSFHFGCTLNYVYASFLVTTIPIPLITNQKQKTRRAANGYQENFRICSPIGMQKLI